LSHFRNSRTMATGGICMEISVLEYDGITFIDGGRALCNEELAVTVAFSGSAAMMEIRSSALCSQTGKLVVESNSSLSKSDLFEEDEAQAARFKATWKQEACLPHAVVVFPKTTFNTLKYNSLVEGNRDSKILKKVVSSDGETVSTASMATLSTKSSSFGMQSKEHQQECQPLCSPWSDASTPEILEFTVTITSTMDDSFVQGAAFLVVGGNDEIGTYSVDLPVRPTKSKGKSSFHLADSARLKLLISIQDTFCRQEVQREQPPSSSLLSSNEYPRKMKKHKYRQSEEVVGPQMLIEVPIDGKDAARPYSCGEPISWSSLLNTLTSAVSRCDDGSGMGVAFSGDSIDSTIATRRSFDS